MNSGNQYLKLENWVDQCLSKGKYSFNLEEVRDHFQKDSAAAIKQSLNRLVRKQKVVSVFKSYYVIVSPQYQSMGILPASMFIDGLMTYLGRKYYVGLLNAAALHGSSHQQPQEYFVVTEYPVLRATHKKGVRINYISTRKMPPVSLTEKKKTTTGFITVSKPILTALDLISYEKRTGGLNRASEVIYELLEIIKPKDINEEFIMFSSVSALQRIGYIFEEVLKNKVLAERIIQLSQKAGLKFSLIPLKASGSKEYSDINGKWKIEINTEIDIES
ncbi:MAG: hypothetical protein NTW49_08200 [Bacteroidia bacterium]|nr:hypothetical protein [Bacteroidia bacterium]